MSNLNCPTCSSFSQAVQLLKGKDKRTICYKTTIEAVKSDDVLMAVDFRHHDTVIVRYFPNGHCQLNTNDWRTATTKNRINHLSPIHVTQSDRVWRFGRDNHLFLDNMTVTKYGEPV